MWISNKSIIKCGMKLLNHSQTSTSARSLGMDKWLQPIFHWACDYLYMMELQLNHVSKRSPWLFITMLILGALKCLTLENDICSNLPYSVAKLNGMVKKKPNSITVTLYDVASQIYSGGHQRENQQSASLPFLGESTGDRWILFLKGQ